MKAYSIKYLERVGIVEYDYDDAEVVQGYYVAKSGGALIFEKIGVECFLIRPEAVDAAMTKLSKIVVSTAQKLVRLQKEMEKLENER